MRKFADEEVVSTNAAEDAVGGRSFAARWNCADMIDVIGSQLKQRWGKFLHLQVDILQVVPGRGFISELVYGGATVIADCRSEISTPDRDQRRPEWYRLRSEDPRRSVRDN